jgi:hypothetical protein
MSLFHLIKRRQWRTQTAISAVRDQGQEMQTSGREIVRVFSEHMRRKYSPIQTDDECARKLLAARHYSLSECWRETLEVPITTEELTAAVFKEDSKKSPGRDRIVLELFKVL